MLLDHSLRRFTSIKVLGEPGTGNAFLDYEIVPVSTPGLLAKISFQKGSIHTEINGTFNEDLLDIVAHRLACFQTSEFACEENEKALEAVLEALKWLGKRTRARQANNLEGQYIKHPTWNGPC
jgi:hypothetical protein